MSNAIDFGQTQCKASRINQSGKAEAVLNLRGEPSTPTALYIYTYR